MGFHEGITPAQGIHVSHNYDYADEAARLAATGFVPADVGKIACQQADQSFFILVDDAPIVWKEITYRVGARVAQVTGTDTTPGFYDDKIVMGASGGITKTILSPAGDEKLELKLTQKSNYAAVIDPAIGDDSTAGYSVGSRWLNTVSRAEFVCTDASAGAALWAQTTPVAGSAVFGTEYAYAEDDSASPTSLATYQQKLRLTTAAIPAGDYQVMWTYQLLTDNAARSVFARVELDDTTTLIENETVDTTYAATPSGHKRVTLGAGVHTFDIDYRAGAASPTRQATIRNCRITLWRVS